MRCRGRAGRACARSDSTERVAKERAVGYFATILGFGERCAKASNGGRLACLFTSSGGSGLGLPCAFRPIIPLSRSIMNDAGMRSKTRNQVTRICKRLPLRQRSSNRETYWNRFRYRVPHESIS